MLNEKNFIIKKNIVTNKTKTAVVPKTENPKIKN